jgi:hypothetical protein
MRSGWNEAVRLRCQCLPGARLMSMSLRKNVAPLSELAFGLRLQPQLYKPADGFGSNRRARAGSRWRAFLWKRPRLVSASPGPPTLSWGLGGWTAESHGQTPAGNISSNASLWRAISVLISQFVPIRGWVLSVFNPSVLSRIPECPNSPLRATGWKTLSKVKEIFRCEHSKNLIRLPVQKGI